LYNLIISKLYKEDTLSAYNYIKNVLNAPIAAKNLKNEVKDKLMHISKNPTHRPLVYDKYIKRNSFRGNLVKGIKHGVNSNIFYTLIPCVGKMYA